MRAICSVAILLLAAWTAHAAAPPLELTPEPGLTLRLREDSVTATGPESFTWRGRVEGDPLSSATFLVSGATQIGIVRAQERAWIVRTDATGAVSIEEQAPSEESEGDDVLVPSPPDPSASRANEPSAEGASPDVPADDGSIIDILVVYTAQARARMPDIEAQIALAVEDTNGAFLRSAVATRLRLVHVQQVDYVESNWTLTDLDRMRDPDDGYMDDVPELQSACGADIASLWISNAVEAAGRGVLTRVYPAPHPGRNDTHDVVVVSQAVGGMTFAHEVGHNLGCMHDRANSGYAGAFSYSYGYIEPRCRFRTIMAYGTCPRIANYANPDIDSGGRPTGVPLGDPEEAHNALSLNGTVSTVANFHQAAAGCCRADGFEPDDSSDAARPLWPGAVQVHDFCEDTTDWLSFPVVAGRTYEMETLDLEPSVNTALRLHDDGGSVLLAWNDDIAPGNLASRITWTATLTGLVRLRVTQDPVLNGGPGRSYRLRFSGDVSPPEPSADGRPVPLLVTKDAAGAPVVSVERVPSATSLIAFEGSLDDDATPTSRTCVTAWRDAGDSVLVDGLLAGSRQWIAIASSGPGGESSAGRRSDGIERRGAGWPVTPACP